MNHKHFRKVTYFNLTKCVGVVLDADMCRIQDTPLIRSVGASKQLRIYAYVVLRN